MKLFNFILVVLVLVGCSKKATESVENSGELSTVDYVVLSPAEGVDFGSFSTDDAPVVKTFGLSNNESITKNLTPTIQEESSPFSIIYHNCSTVAKVRSCQVKVRFNPQIETGSHVAHLVTDGILHELSATVVASSVSFQALEGGMVREALSFGEVSGLNSVQKILSIKNLGGWPALLGSLSISPDFSLVLNSCGSELKAGAACSVRLLFQAQGKAPGEYNGVLSSSNGFSLSLSAEIPSPPAPSVSLNFVEGNLQLTGEVNLGSVLGSQTVAKTIFVRNNNAQAVAAAQVSLGSNMELLYDQCSGKIISPKGSCRLIVRFSAASKAPGTYAATLAYQNLSLDLAAEVLASLVCGEDQHEQSGSCVANLRSCVITNGSGQETWLGNQWSACTVQACNAEFHEDANQCAADVISCVGEIAHAASASQTWNGSAYGACVLESCSSGYEASGNTCVAEGGGENQAPVVAFDMFNLVDENDYIEIYPTVTDTDGSIASMSVSIKKTAPSVVDPYTPNTSIRCVNARGGSNLGMLNCLSPGATWVEFRLNNDVGTYEITVTATDNDGASTSLTKTLVNATNNHLLLAAQVTVGDNAQAIDNGQGRTFVIPANVISQNLGVHANIEYRWRVRNQAAPQCRYPIINMGVPGNQRNYVYGVNGTTPNLGYTFNLGTAAVTGSGCPDISHGTTYNVQLRVLDPTPTSRVARFAGYNLRVNEFSTPQFGLFVQSDKKVQGGGTIMQAVYQNETLDPGEGIQINFQNIINLDPGNNLVVGVDLDNNGTIDLTKPCVIDEENPDSCFIVLDPALDPTKYFGGEVAGDGDGVCERGETCQALQRVVRITMEDEEGDRNQRYWQFNFGSGPKPVVMDADGNSLIYTTPSIQDAWANPPLPLARMNGSPVEVTYHGDAITKGSGAACSDCLTTIDIDDGIMTTFNWPWGNYSPPNNGNEIVNSASLTNNYEFDTVGQYLYRATIADGVNRAVTYGYNIITQAGSLPADPQPAGEFCSTPNPYQATYTISDGGDTWYPMVIWDENPGDGIFEQWDYWSFIQVNYGGSKNVNLHVISEDFTHEITPFVVNAPADENGCF